MLQTDLPAGQVQVLDFSGKTIMRQPFTRGRNVQVNRLAAGPYVLLLSDKNGKPYARRVFLKN